MVKQEKVSAEDTIRHIRRETRRKYNVEGKIRIVLEGLRDEDSIQNSVSRNRKPQYMVSSMRLR